MTIEKPHSDCRSEWIGAGRLGKVYVRDLATRIPETTVVAVADIDRALAAVPRRNSTSRRRTARPTN